MENQELMMGRSQGITPTPFRLLAQFEKGEHYKKAEGRCEAQKTPPNRKRRIKTIFNHFRNKHARYLLGL